MIVTGTMSAIAARADEHQEAADAVLFAMVIEGLKGRYTDIEIGAKVLASAKHLPPCGRDVEQIIERVMVGLVKFGFQRFVDPSVRSMYKGEFARYFSKLSKQRLTDSITS